MDYKLKPKPDIPEEILKNWQDIVDTLAILFNVPSGLIMKVDEHEIEVFLTSNSKGNPYPKNERGPLNTGLYCETVMETKKELLVPNALTDPNWDKNPDIKLDMVSYLGVPLYWSDNQMFGTLCVLDNKENSYNKTYRNLLAQFASGLRSNLAIIEAKHKIEDQKYQLENTLEQLKSSHNKLMKNAYQSGMAEFAVHSLHGFGNAIGQQILAVKTIEREINSFPLEKLNNSNKILNENMDLMEKFLEKVPKSRSVLGFIKDLPIFFKDKGEKIKNELRMISKSNEKVMEIIDFLRDFPDMGETIEDVSLPYLLEENFISRVEGLKSKGIILEKEWEEVPLIKGKPFKILHLFNILLKNAQESLENVNNPKILTRIFKDGENVSLSVKDNGAGVEPEDMSKIFKMGFSKKEGHSGHGLHLAANIIGECGGIILPLVDSHEKGIEFKCSFPISSAKSP